jgi:Ribosomal protein L7/L12 C-terminal domain
MESALLAITIGILLMTWIAYSSTTARLRGVERKLNALLRHHGVDPTQGLLLSDRVKLLATDPGRKIEAIKVYRQETGAGLAEAKEAVESFFKSTTNDAAH